jgi:signal transduction histidine kinase
MQIDFISYVPAIIGILAIGAFVLLNARNVSNKIFAILNFSIAAWLLCLFLANLTSSPLTALWLIRFALFFGALLFLFFFIFALVFPYKTRLSKQQQILYSLPLIAIAVLSFTPWVVPEVKVTATGAQLDNVGLLYTISDLVGVLYILGGIGLLLRKHRDANSKQRSQIKFVITGLVIAIIANVFTGDILTLLHVDTAYVDFGGLSLFVFSAFVAYAILKHGFLDIRLIVARTLAYALTLTSIALIYSVTIFGLLARFTNVGTVHGGQQLIYIVAAVFLSFTFEPIKVFFNKITNRLFFRDSYDPQLFLDQLNKTIIDNIELGILLRRTAEIIEQNLKSERAFFVVYEEGASEASRYIGSKGRIDALKNMAHIREEIEKRNHKVLVADDLQGSARSLGKLMREDQLAIVSRLQSVISPDTQANAYLFLGDKKSGNIYSSQDRRVIEIISNELVIAIQNARRFEEIENFNATLQEKINQATRSLRKANEKLKALDETKDDFISMASHQLRTPLTSVKGYISMVLEGDAGKLTSQQKEMLGQAFFSSQRMVYLIADLLNVSRLKTGKFIIEPSTVNLPDMVEQELSQLEETAAARGLKLIYDKPTDFPAMLLDETKTRQVIMNFADNAIYYTPSGGTIHVRLINNPGTIELRVEDDGIGVPKSEQPHLFTKFYRAGNARKARPDGTGLGLFMAKKVIVAQGGSLIFESQEGKGSTFGFIFSKSKLAVSADKPSAEPVAAK